MCTDPLSKSALRYKFEGNGAFKVKGFEFLVSEFSEQSARLYSKKDDIWVEPTLLGRKR